MEIYANLVEACVAFSNISARQRTRWNGAADRFLTRLVYWTWKKNYAREGVADQVKWVVLHRRMLASW
jgi:hypothetical protein